MNKLRIKCNTKSYCTIRRGSKPCIIVSWRWKSMKYCARLTSSSIKVILLILLRMETSTWGSEIRSIRTLKWRQSSKGLMTISTTLNFWNGRFYCRRLKDRKLCKQWIKRKASWIDLSKRRKPRRLSCSMSGTSSIEGLKSQVLRWLMKMASCSL